MFWKQISLLLTSLVVLTHCNVMYDVKLVTHECLKNRAISGNYTPQGTTINIGDLLVYEAKENENNKRMLIGAYDGYGLTNDNVKQVIDEMALQNGGFRAIIPDFFRGDNYNFEPDPNNPNLEEVEDWLNRVGDWDSIVKPDLINLVRHYRNEGVEEFAIFGFCWGGKVSTLASIELSDDFKASGLVHPSFVTNDEAEDVKIPMFLMPSQDEPDMLPFYEVLFGKFGDNSGHRRFDDMIHGFAGARGNFSDPLNQERVNEVITTLGAFFDRNLNGNNGNKSPSSQPGQLLILTLITFAVFVSQK